MEFLFLDRGKYMMDWAIKNASLAVLTWFVGGWGSLLESVTLTTRGFFFYLAESLDLPYLHTFASLRRALGRQN